MAGKSCIVCLLSDSKTAFLPVLCCAPSAFRQAINQLWSCVLLEKQLFEIKLNLVWAELHLRRFITDVFVHSINGERRGPAWFEAISTVLFTRGLHGTPKKVISHLCKFYKKRKSAASWKKRWITWQTRIYALELTFLLCVYRKRTYMCFLLPALWLCHSEGFISLLSIIRYTNADVCKRVTQEAFLDSRPQYDKQH